MKGHKIFLKIDFVVQTLLIGIFILSKIIYPKPFIAENVFVKIGIPALAIWLIVAGTINKIQYKNNFRFRINRFWFFLFFGGLVFVLNEITISNSVHRIFTNISWGAILANYFSVIYEYANLEKEPPKIPHLEDILDDNKF